MCVRCQMRVKFEFGCHVYYGQSALHWVFFPGDAPSFFAIQGETELVLHHMHFLIFFFLIEMFCLFLKKGSARVEISTISSISRKL